MGSINDMDLNVEAGIDQSTYEEPSQFSRPPDPGEYTLLREGKVEASFSKDKKDLYFKFDATIQGGADDGKTVDNFVTTTVSQWRKSTSADDYVRACGSQVVSRRGSGKPFLADYKDGVEGNPGPFNAVIGWKGYCSTCEEETVGGKKQPKFPTDAEGKLVHETECPTCGTRIGARAKILRYVVVV